MTPGERKDPSVRGFGAVMLVAGAFVAWRLARHGHAVPSRAVLVVGVALALFAFVAPSRAMPLARAWQRLGEAMGRVTTPVMLTAVFVLVVIPTRIAMALARVDPMQRRFDRAASTYWEDRPDEDPSPARFEHPW